MVLQMLFDILGTFVSLLSTYLFIRLNNKAWPVGIIATLVNGWLYWYKGIYADMVLEFIYFLSMCYGWYLWNQQPSDNISQQVRLGKLSAAQWTLLLFTLCIVFLTIQYLLHHYTNSNVAFMDSASTALSLVAQWLMCHKIIVTWMLWFITDALYAFMYLSKDLPFHCGLMLVYTGMAVTGYYVWAQKNKLAH